MVLGTAPSEASDRLQIFQARFDELWRKYQTYSGKYNTFLHSSNSSLINQPILMVFT